MPLRIGGLDYEVGYQCNLVAGGSGSITFSLDKPYRRFTVSIGFAEGPGSSLHSVRFEIIGDDRVYLIEPRTLRFGEHADLDVDVSGITRLKFQVSELGPTGGSGSASRPAFARPSLS